jgi:hypothetical protein
MNRDLGGFPQVFLYLLFSGSLHFKIALPSQAFARNEGSHPPK